MPGGITKPRRSRKSIASTDIAKEGALSEPTPKASRKSRSKSLGPGGLAELIGKGKSGSVLRDGDGNKRRASIAPVQVKSILKPTLPLSPLAEIPAHRPKAQEKNGGAPAQPNFGVQPKLNQHQQTIPLRTEEEQQRRAQILAQRAARRQSLGNRRVSFAAEATLHTWDVQVEYGAYDGSSTPGSSMGGSSAASTPESNRRRSRGSLSGVDFTPTPAKRSADSLSPQTPPSARQKRARRASLNEMSPMDLNNPSGDLASSPLSASPDGDDTAQLSMDEASASDGSDSGSDDETEGGNTFISAIGDSTMGENTRMSMGGVDNMTSMLDETGTVKPFFKKPAAWKFEGETMHSSSPARQPAVVEKGDDETAPMEFTTAVGGLLSAPERPTEGVNEDETAPMEFTAAIGGLLSASSFTARENIPKLAFSPDTIVDAVLKPNASRIEPPKTGLLIDIDDSDDASMDMTCSYGAIINEQKKRQSLMTRRDLEDSTAEMDMTMAVGGILAAPSAVRSRQSIAFAVGQGAESPKEMDMTMEMDVTRPIGGILSTSRTVVSSNPPASSTPTATLGIDGNEDMTMEFTSVLGGIIGGAQNQNDDRQTFRTKETDKALMSGDEWAREQADLQRRRGIQDTVEAGIEMEETIALGRILPNSASTEGPKEITYPTVPSTSALEAQPGPNCDGDDGVPMSWASVSAASNGRGPVDLPVPAAQNTPAVESPTHTSTPPTIPQIDFSFSPGTPRATRRSSGAASAQRAAGARRTSLQRSNIAQRGGKTPTPKKAEASPVAPPVTVLESNQLRTPEKSLALDAAAHSPATPPNQIGPVKKPRTPSKRTPAPATPLNLVPQNGSFSLSAKKRAGVGSPTPRKTSTPSTPRTVSLRGVGIDKPGLGSPAVARMISRRASLTDATIAFSPVALPKDLLKAAKEDRAEDAREEMEERKRETEAVQNMDLMSKIQNINTPQKRARKSMAYGMLVPEKRALDFSDHGLDKRRKSADGSEHLFSDELTFSGASFKTGQLLPPGSARRTPGKTPKEAKGGPVVRRDQPESPTKIPTKPPAPEQALQLSQDSEPDNRPEEEAGSDYSIENVTLKEFLDAVGVSFLDDLTYRRSIRFHGQRESNSHGDPASAIDILIAGACTSPMVDLYQHACRELKKYTKALKSSLHDDEKSINDANPPLFKEYMLETPDVKLVMDSQFKNIKEHARLHAKCTWYDWRMELLGQITPALSSTLKGLVEDEKVLDKQLSLLAPLLPGIKHRWEEAKRRLAQLEEIKRRVESDDQESLQDARNRLRVALERIEVVRKDLKIQRADLETTEASIKSQETKKAELQASIEEAERIKEMNRGWSVEELRTWKSKCEDLEKRTGWSVSGARKDGLLELNYRREVKLVCDPRGHEQPIVEYIASGFRKPSERPILPELERNFFISGLSQRLRTERNPKTIMRIVADHWQNADAVMGNITRLRLYHHTNISLRNDGNLFVKATVLAKELRSKMEVGFIVAQDSLQTTQTGVKVVYGGISEKAIQGMMVQWAGSWREGIGEAIYRCVEARNRGGAVAVDVQG